MKLRLLVWGLPFWLGVCLVVPSAQAAADAKPEKARAVSTPDLKPGPGDPTVSLITAKLLEQHQYLHQPFNAEVSSRFLDHYLKDLDPQRIHFIQPDVEQFEGYRKRLHEWVLLRHDTTPAYVIFSLFMRRLEQRMDYSIELLKKEKFDFNTNEKVSVNRKDSAYPKDLEEAHQLWRDRVRLDYLAEKMNQPNPQEIAKLVLEKLRQDKPEEILASIRDSKAKNEALKSKQATQTNAAPDAAEAKAQNVITLALKGKMSEDRAEKIANLVAELLPREKPAAIAKAISEAVATEDKQQIVDTLTRRYARILRSFKDWDSENVLEIFLNALAHTYDPHSDYMGKSVLENFSIGMNLSLFGIGAELGWEDGYCKIRRLLPGGPAKESGKLKDNDKIVAVGQSNQPPVDIVDMPLTKAVNLIRGPKDTEVRLTVLPGDGTDNSPRKVVSLIRREIKLEDQEAKAKIIDLPASDGGHVRFGVIDLPSFYSTMDLGVGRGKSEPRSTTDDVAKLLKKLESEGVNGIILDLRRNGGGSLEEAIRLTGLFIKKGPVVQVADPDGTVTVDEDKDPSVAYDGPLIVLTSRFSASASEIVAAALQDYERAVLVGETSTHGKGTVQNLNSLRQFIRPQSETATNDPGAVKLTIRKFYRANGLSTQLEGVTPDVVLPSINNVLEVGERALDNPLVCDKIRSATYEKLDRVAPYLPELKRLSSERVAKEKDFDYVRQDMAIIKKAQDEKTVSLNEAERVKEKEDSEARAKARDKERLARKEPDKKVYEITLKLADQPGLPPPVAKTNALASAKGSGATGAVGASSASVASPHGDADATVDDEKAPPIDVQLEEAEQIMADYLKLLPKRAVVTANELGNPR